MTLLPTAKYIENKPYTTGRHIEFVHDNLSPFGSHEMCDACDGVAEAVRFPVSVSVSNFTDMDQAGYVELFVSQDWKGGNSGRWWRPGYPAILSAISSVNETIDVCSVPQQFSHAPSFMPTPEPSKKTKVGRRRLQGEGGEEEEEEEEEEAAEDPTVEELGQLEQQQLRRRLTGTKVGVAAKTASSALNDDLANDDKSMAQLGCCLGSPGPMYMVACVVRNWVGTNAGLGHKVKGPPFDDRCVAVTGVCGNTCGADFQFPGSAHCEAGIIPQRFLVSDYCGSSEDDTDGSHNCGDGTDRVSDDYEVKRKKTIELEDSYFHLPFDTSPEHERGWWEYAPVIKGQPVWHWSFMLMMFLAYTSMTLAFLPGIGRCGSSRARLPILHTLNSQGAIKDGVECVSFSISASEHKLWVLRNLVGKVASSFYHPQALLTDFFMDETARSGAYAIWDALSRFVNKDEACQVDMVGFLKAWAARLRDPAELLQESEDRFKVRGDNKKLLSQIEQLVDPFHNIGALASKYGLSEDDLAELHYAYELYELIDCMLDKRVWTGWDVLHDEDERPSVVEPGVRLYDWEADQSGGVSAAAVEAVGGGCQGLPEFTPTVTNPLAPPLALQSNARGVSLESSASLASEGWREESKEGGNTQVELRPPRRTGGGQGQGGHLCDVDAQGHGRSQQQTQQTIPEGMTQTHMAGFRDWLGHGSFSVFMVQWAQSLLELAASKKKGYKSLDPFSSEVLSFAKDDVTNCQVAEELQLFDDGGRFKKGYVDCKKHKTMKAHDFLEVKDGRICFFFGTYVSRPLRMIYANRGKPEQREATQNKVRILVPGVYACLNGTHPDLPALDPSTYYDYSTPSPYPAPYNGRISQWEAYRRCYGLVNRELGHRFFSGAMTQVLELVKLSEDMLKIQAQLTSKFPQKHKGAESEERIELPAAWLDPQQRCRGKAGGMNFSVRILEDREQLELAMGLKAAPPNLKLYSIFDCRHMVTPGFWEQTILHFFRDSGGVVRREESVMYCQVPQNFVGIELKTDYLDMQNEYLFRYVNCIRDGVGAVTSCGTNCVWALERGFEYEERTMIEDTATSHKVLLSGYEGTYHYEKLIFGTPKDNKDFLAAVFRWSRGAVQLFWISFFGGAQGKSGPYTFWKILACTVGFLGFFTFGMLIASTVWEAFILYVVFFFLVVIGFWVLTTGTYAHYLRYVVLIDNTTYFYGTFPAYFWALVLPSFMCFKGKIPFNYYFFTLVPGAFFWEIVTWMLMHEVKYWSIVEGKRPREISILRSQQMYFVTTPLHGVATYSGARSGYRILRKHLDASSWSSFGHGGPGDWVVYWLCFLLCVQCLNVVASIIGIGTMCTDGSSDDDEVCVMRGKTFVAYLVGAVTSCLFIALVFDPFCILYFGSTKTLTMKHAYLVFWLVIITIGVLLLLGAGGGISNAESQATHARI
eukprot:CAMPEP_0171825626 /NCGR_PEP_ID=MMETSP0992-20121227/5639_1 /TAXON_ID=483369 /ORGANISM="non described non described, Strain CCMP2098" /LENGTH=1435 /DNA_ID=CAMNT_0012440573 /DNA_START=137 /DNA_END=4444 /DNA_ORIENTATION=-